MSVEMASSSNADQVLFGFSPPSASAKTLLDAITQPPPPRRIYRAAPPPQAYQQQPQPYQPQQVQTQNIQVQDEQAGPEGGKKKVVKHYDANGKLISEEEIYY